jgi:crotonobetainyl-CoA:carnitine CoA-transferase CaiB-like acyl-CoA transferase
MFHGTPLDLPSAPVGAPLDDVLAEWGTGRSAPAEADGTAAPSAKPLDGLRVLDFTWVLAGPFCNRMLGDLGADIIKLQTAERATLVNSPDFPYFYCWNRSKRSVALDMKGPGALELMRKLVENADVLIENYSAGVLDRWGLDYETVRSWNPRIIYVTMSGCGHEGPWNKMITYAPTIHALCGMTWLSNPPDRGDVGAGFSLNDHAAGFTAAYAILAAVEGRRTTGVGQHVDIAQIEVGAYLVGSALTDYLTNGREAVPTGNADPYATYAVNEVFRCASGELAVTVRDDADRAAAERVIGGGLDALAAWCAQRDAASAMEALQAAGVPAGQVQSGVELSDDPQLAARDFFGTFDSPVFGQRPFDRFPAKFASHQLDPYVPPPAYLGEHAFEVLGEIAGMDEEQIAIAMGDGLLQ